MSHRTVGWGERYIYPPQKLIVCKGSPGYFTANTPLASSFLPDFPLIPYTLPQPATTPSLKSPAAPNQKPQPTVPISINPMMALGIEIFFYKYPPWVLLSHFFPSFLPRATRAIQQSPIRQPTHRRVPQIGRPGDTPISVSPAQTQWLKRVTIWLNQT